jgi:hypothetical protein
MLRCSCKNTPPEPENPRIHLHLHLQTFLHQNTQKQQRKWMYTKKSLHSLGTHCVRRTNTGSDFRCALNQTARVKPQFPDYAVQTPDTRPAAVSRAPRQHFFIWLLLEACIVTLLREDCLVFTAMHLHVSFIQLYIYCIGHRNWSLFSFYPPSCNLVIIVCVCVCYICFFLLILYIYKVLNFKFRVFYKFSV